MRGLPSLDIHQSHRVRRWDAVVLGGALPGLVAAARLTARGAQVLVIEEESAVSAFPGLREPFLMTGVANDSVLGACLTALGVSLIERRNFVSEPLAYQVALPDARVNIGDVERTAQEIACWALAGREDSRDLVAALDESATAEGARLLASQVSAATRRGARGVLRSVRPRSTPDTPADRNIAHAIASTGDLSALIEAQSRALGDFGMSPPSASIRNRLVGAALNGAVSVSGKEPWIAALLRRRIEARHGEFRRVSGSFRIVQAGDLPAITTDESQDVSAARALIINAPASLLSDADDPQSAPGNKASNRSWLQANRQANAPTGRRLSLHLRGSRKLLPSGMASRVICVRDTAEPMNGTNVVRVRTFESGSEVDLIADATVPVDTAGDERSLEAIGRSLVSLMPLGDEGWVRVAVPTPRWDRGDLLTDPADTDTDPISGLQRPLSRLPAYVLDRSQIAQRGFEGDLMLGWQAGDAIAAELG